MAVRKTSWTEHFDRTEAQVLSNTPAAENQKFSASEFNDLAQTIDTNADELSQVITSASLLWRTGHIGSRAWITNENGEPVEYHAAPGATEAQIASTVPGSTTAVWLPTPVLSDTDFVNSYNAAKA